MMRSEEDLRAVLTARQGAAQPDHDTVVAGLRGAVQQRRRRTAGAVVVAAVAVLAAISVPALALRGAPAPDMPGGQPAGGAPPPAGYEPAPPLDPTDRPPFGFTVSPGVIAGYQLTPRVVTPEYQILTVAAPGGAPYRIWLVAYQPGTQERVASDTPGHDLEPQPALTAVGTAPAWFSARGDTSVLRWEYAPGAVAVLGSKGEPPLAEAVLREVAEGVEFVAAYPARVPYRLSYLPPGLEPVSLTQDFDPASRRSVTQFMGAEGAVDISVGEDFRHGNPEWDWQATTIAGHPAHCADLVDGRRCQIDIDSVPVSLGSGHLTGQLWELLVAGLTLTTWEDPDSWYAFEDALPTG